MLDNSLEVMGRNRHILDQVKKSLRDTILRKDSLIPLALILHFTNKILIQQIHPGTQSNIRSVIADAGLQEHDINSIYSYIRIINGMNIQDKILEQLTIKAYNFEYEENSPGAEMERLRLIQLIIQELIDEIKQG